MENINDIISSLSQADIDTLKDVATSIFGEGNSKEENTTATKTDFSSLNFSPTDLNMMLKAKNIFDKMNSTSSKDVDLIMALKPHLSSESQEKADKAMRILKILEILPYVKDLF